MATQKEKRGDGTRLLSLATLAERSAISKYTWRSWLQQGRLPAVRLGRRLLVEERDYERFVAEHRK